MGATEKPRDLLNYKQFGAIAGLTERTAGLYRDNIGTTRTPAFPKPDKKINNRFYWFRKTCEKWAAIPRPMGKAAKPEVEAVPDAGD